MMTTTTAKDGRRERLRMHTTTLFTERLPHMNLTRRVGMRAGDFPYEDFTTGKDGRTTTTRTDENATLLLLH
jgi:hypothetical protein